MGQHQVCRTPFLRSGCGEGWGKIANCAYFGGLEHGKRCRGKLGYGGRAGVGDVVFSAWPGAPPLVDAQISVYTVLNVATS